MFVQNITDSYVLVHMASMCAYLQGSYGCHRQLRPTVLNLTEPPKRKFVAPENRNLIFFPT